MSTVKEFIKTTPKTSIEVKYTGENPNMDEDPNHPMNHYKVTLRRAGRQITIQFSTGCGWTREPDAADVLDCLASDAGIAENCRDFTDFCNEFGYDEDSRRAERTYEAILAQTKKLKTFLDEDFDKVVFELERL